MATADEQSSSLIHRMYRPPQNGEQQVKLDDVIERLRASMPKIPGMGNVGGLIIILIIAIIAVVIWALTGIYTVGPDEQAVLRRFGEFQRIDGEGLHWYWPSPIGNRNVVKVTTTRQLEVGFRSGREGAAIASSIPAEAQMITGDENIVDVQAVIQYRIGNVQDFLFNVDDPGEPDRGIAPGNPDGRTLRDIAETAIRQVVGARNIDVVLTTQREQVQNEVMLKMRELAGQQTPDNPSGYGTGIEILQVLLQNVNPPAEVQAAFEDVVRAREDRERTINLAKTST